MKTPTYLFLFILITACQPICLLGEVSSDPDPTRFAETIAGFAAADSGAPLPTGGIVFVGSSSIRRMDVPKFLPKIEALNRGFGGSHISDVNHYIEETVLKYRPSITVFYCGGNDIWSGKSPIQVLEDFREFYGKLFDSVPNNQLLLLASRPSPKRHTGFNTELALNYLFQMEAGKDDRIIYLSGACDRFFDEDGNFFHGLYHNDQLHMSEAGYRIWQEILTPHLTR
ncbi:MAG: GDSL-type esterase/lipase family protein [Verrucomicrobia bacterium]|nr:GDSL-type esterase/lipase family protein [Verrucomicrobiota bacterium]